MKSSHRIVTMECLLQLYCNRWNCPDVSLFIVHICLGYWRKEKMEGWKDWEAVAAYANTHHANSTVIYWESCQRRGQMTFTHSYQWKISLDRDFFIASLVAPGPSLDSVFMSVCRCVSVCCCIKLTLSWASGRRNTSFYLLVPLVGLSCL